MYYFGVLYLCIFFLKLPLTPTLGKTDSTLLPCRIIMRDSDAPADSIFHLNSSLDVSHFPFSLEMNRASLLRRFDAKSEFRRLQ